MTASVAEAGRWLTCAAVLNGMLWKGAAIPIPFFLVCVVIAAAVLAALFSRFRSRGAEVVFGTCVVLAAALAALALAQSVFLPGNPLANPLWGEAGSLLPVDGGAVSINPDMTRRAVLTLLAPFFLFAAALRLFGRDEDALFLLRFLALAGAVFGAFGIVQVTLAPDSLLFFEKTFYKDSLTGTFVNRNTAGTLLGLASFAAATWIAAVLQGILPGRPAFAGELLAPTYRSGRFRLAWPCFLLAIILLALFLTRSRGAMLATVAAYGVTLPLLIVEVARRRAGLCGEAKAWGAGSRIVATAAALGAIVLVVGLFGGLTSLRIQLGGIDAARICLYEASLEAIRENWALGTGFGAFQSTFPAYREAACSETRFVVLRAHNAFLEGTLGFGFLFLPALLCAYAAAVWTLWTGFRTRRRFRFVAITGTGSLLMLSLHSLVDFSIQIPGLAIYFSALLAAVASICLGRAGIGWVPSVARRAVEGP